ncbi:type II secretion system F family protein [Jatrophihabitans sp. YIM 134969]
MTATLPQAPAAAAPATGNDDAVRSWAYEALDANQDRVKGVVDANGIDAARAAVRALGLTPLTLNPTGQGLQREISLFGAKRVKQKDLAVFARQFATLAGSGLSLLRSLTVLEQQSKNPTLAKTLGEVRSDIESGLSLSDAMARHERVFPRLVVAMVRAGETGGFLDDALERIAEITEKDAALRGKIKSAMTYPSIVLLFSVAMVAVVLVFIVPIFEGMFASLGGELPLPTQVIVSISHAMVWLAPLTLVLIGGTVLGVRMQLRRSPAWRLRFDGLLLRLPIFGPLLSKIAISRFTRTLGTLLEVGVPAMQALDVVGETSGNAVIGRTAEAIKESIRNGRTMSAPMSRPDSVFPPMVGQMVEVGEESGQISAMLDKIADFYDREVDEATDSLTAAIEPVMVVGMGGIVGTMVVCLYLPMFTIYQNIQGAT